MTRYVFYSHDGYGLGHVRRNHLIAQAVLRSDPTARVSLVTGLRMQARPRWLGAMSRLRVHRVPALIKNADGSYRNETMSFEDAVCERERIFADLVERERPQVVVVDRHPYGTGGELRQGLGRAREHGAAIVLGLRDVLDDPEIVQEEVQGLGWVGVEDLYDEILVYGRPHFVDHEAAYGLPMTPRYCGWVVQRPRPDILDEQLLVVAAGGGGDGASVFELGARLLVLRPELYGLFAAGPYIDSDALSALDGMVPARARVVRPADTCGRWFTRAGVSLCMAGYNSTMEVLAAGRRPILMPRLRPRREQAIRAERLAALGLADVVGVDTDAADLVRLMQRPRFLDPQAMDVAGLDLDGADTAARRLQALSTVRSAR